MKQSRHIQIDEVDNGYIIRYLIIRDPFNPNKDIKQCKVHHTLDELLTDIRQVFSKK